MSSETPSVGSIGQVCHATKESAVAVKRLAASELELAGAAMMRAALLATLATACAASAAIMLMILLVALLIWAGLTWPAAAGVATVISLVSAWFFATRARSMLRHCGMSATRRQLMAMMAFNAETSTP